VEGALAVRQDLTDPAVLKTMSSKELMRLEKDIADRYMGGVPWGSVTWAICNTALWFSLWPLTLSGLLPLWAAFPLATISIILSYLPSHEAQHRIIARPGETYWWLNELVGTVSTLSLVMPYGVARLTHYEHHLHANDPELDPDIGTKADNGWDFIRRSIAGRQPGGRANNAYGATLKRLGTPEAARAGLEAIALQLTYLVILFALAWSGHAIEAALIWWLPRHIAVTYIGFYLSWAPHHPAHQMGRYRDTRAFRSRLGNILTMGMQYHIVHHLYPRIPLMRTPAAYRALRPVLEARGCDLERM
jgi:beta-carotene hydroxylase